MLSADEDITWNGNEFALTICGEPPNHSEKPLSDYPKCQKEEIFGAQGYFIENTYHHNDSDCFSLGSITSKPHVSHELHRNTSYLTIDFFGGSTCKESPNLKYSALVRIQCSAFEQPLEYDGDVSCEHWFSMKHPAGCAVHQVWVKQFYSISRLFLKNFWMGPISSILT